MPASKPFCCRLMAALSTVAILPIKRFNSRARQGSSLGPATFISSNDFSHFLSSLLRAFVSTLDMALVRA
jgi:hypothetical protein